MVGRFVKAPQWVAKCYANLHKLLLFMVICLDGRGWKCCILWWWWCLNSLAIVLKLAHTFMSTCSLMRYSGTINRVRCLFLLNSPNVCQVRDFA